MSCRNGKILSNYSPTLNRKTCMLLNYLGIIQNDTEIHEHNMKYVSARSLPGIISLRGNRNKQYWKATLIELYFY